MTKTSSLALNAIALIASFAFPNCGTSAAGAITDWAEAKRDEARVTWAEMTDYSDKA